VNWLPTTQKNEKKNLKTDITRAVRSLGLAISSLQITGLLLKKQWRRAVDKKCGKMYLNISEKIQDSKISKLQKNKEK